jgi:hypothetical protein
MRHTAHTGTSAARHRFLSNCTRNASVLAVGYRSRCRAAARAW